MGAPDRVVTVTVSVNGVDVVAHVFVLHPRMWNATDWAGSDVIRVHCEHRPSLEFGPFRGVGDPHHPDCTRIPAHDGACALVPGHPDLKEAVIDHAAD